MLKTEKIKFLAFESGFDLFSVSKSFLDDEKLVYNYSRWISNSFDAEMRYLKEYELKKFDAKLVEPWVRSIIWVGVSYFNSSFYERPSEEYGRVSMYAWGDDYHYVVRKMLEDFVIRLKKVAGFEFRYRIFSDSTPVYEKGFGVVSGIGFQGKNTLLISPGKLGSFFFLGEVLTDLDLEPTEPLNFKGCGSCNLCVSSCPTGALAPYVLDARRCISYLTIEFRGIIPEDLALKFGDWVFGCDVCQQVCPFNKFLYIKKLNTKIKEFTSNVTPFLNLKDVLSIPSQNQFEKIFRGKPILRARRRGLIRNAIIVAVNNKARKLIDDIAKLRNDNDEVVAHTARWATEFLSG
jgi:epoxyqueuosine reductase